MAAQIQLAVVTWGERMYHSATVCVANRPPQDSSTGLDTCFRWENNTLQVVCRQAFTHTHTHTRDWRTRTVVLGVVVCCGWIGEETHTGVYIYIYIYMYADLLFYFLDIYIYILMYNYIYIYIYIARTWLQYLCHVFVSMHRMAQHERITRKVHNKWQHDEGTYSEHT
jgi:hypothetical protein